MSKVTRCRDCGGNIVEPAYPGDGAYPVAPMCSCNDAPQTRIPIQARSRSPSTPQNEGSSQ